MVSTPKAPVLRSSQGRQRIEIKKREKLNDRRVTFTKRRTGLFEKAGELCVLCGAKVVMVTFSEGKKAFSFGSPEPDSVLECYLSGRSPGENEPSGIHVQALSQSKQLYDETSRKLEMVKAQERSASQWASPTGFWWEGPSDDLELDELEYFISAMEELMNRSVAKIEQKKSNNVYHDEIITSNNFVCKL